MTDKSVITARVSANTVAALDDLAKRTGRSRAALIGEAVLDYTEEQTAYLEFIDEGERAVEEGNVISQDEMEKWLEQKVAEAEDLIKQDKAA